ncbi:MAG TPA: hypothetical protein VHO46_10960 [Bacteroidales bacterium]|nr:hypothetical protein [Bacteroidales bacterium]
MKRIISILLLVPVFFTGITIKVASHYCSDQFIASIVSFSGKQATCGMENVKHEKSGINTAFHRCQDLSFSHTFSGNYVPSSINSVDQDNTVPADFAVDLFLPFEIAADLNTATVRPPGVVNPNDVQLDLICIFRI